MATPGNDKIVGTTGADTMVGLAGDDTYTVNNCDDVVTEALNEGIDSVNSSVTYALTDNVENLTLGGTFSIDGIGNDLDNKIVGNGAANRLTTGDGKDTVVAGVGNDTVVSAGFLNATDQIDGGTGFDTLVLNGATVLALTATTVIGVERFKLTGGSYDLTLVDATNGAGLTVDGSKLGAGETLEVDGSAETKAALTAIGGAGADTLIGGAGADVLIGGAGADSLVGGAGKNTVSYAGSSAGVTIDLNVATQGGAGDGAGDTLSGFDHAVGSDLADTLTGTAGNNSLEGGDGADALVAGAGNDTLRGGSGADILDLDKNLTSADTVDGGDGLDTLKLNGNYGAGLTFGANVIGIEEIDLTAGAGNAYKLTLSNTTNVGGLIVDGSTLGATNNLILNAAGETDSSLTATGGAGNDSVSGGAMGDTLSGGGGKDTMLGGAGDDLIDGDGNLDALDKVDGGAGLDTLQLDGPTNVVFGATTVTNFETFAFAAGSTYNLKLNGTTTATALTVDGSALGGADSLTVDGSLETTGKFTFIGGAGADKFVGGGGADTFNGSLGADVMTGGGGLDTVTYAASASVDVDLSSGGAQAGGDAAGDILAGIETLIGSDFDDDLYGDKNANTILGGAGGDFIGGGTGGVAGGNDTLSGETGNDVFDMLDALSALDKLDGGDGFDTLMLEGKYTALAFGATTAINIEEIILAGGFSYALTLNDAITAGDLVVNASGLGALETLRLTGSSDKSALDVTGGDGNDTIVGGAAGDTLRGGAGNDSLGGGTGANIFAGGVGNDTMTGGAGIDTVDYGFSTAITVNLSKAVQGGGGDAAGDQLSAIENVIGGGAADTITGSTLGNLLQGGAGADSLDGGAGNDTLVGGAGADSIVGGAGIDLASYAGSTAVTVDLSLAAQVSGGDASGDKFTTIEGVIGSGFNDTLTSAAANDILQGEGGNDSLIAGTGIDTVRGGLGDDTLNFAANLTGVDKVDGGDGNDTVLLNGNYGAGISLTSANFVNVEEIDLAAGNNYKISINTGTVATSVFIDGSNLAGNTLFVTATGAIGISVQGGSLADTLTGGTGSDNFLGSAGADVLNGNTGVDTVDYSASTMGVTVNLSVTTAQASAGDAAGDKLSNIENAIGSTKADTLIGTKAVNALDGSSGDDLLRGGAGADTLVGGLGNDTADYSTSTAGVNIDLADSDKNSGGDAAGDRLVTVENVTGSNVNDTLSGDDNGNILSGGKGNDSLVGGLGADTLDGGDGIDTIDCSAVKDTNDDDKGIQVDLTAGTGQGEAAEGDSLIAVENVIGSAFNDTLIGSAASNSLTGGAGEDSLATGTAGTDTLLGGLDADSFDLAGSLDAADRIDGGIGITEKGGSQDYDIVQLAGDYSKGVVFSATTMINVEEIDLAAGNSYKLTLNNATNAGELVVDGSKLGVGETLVLIASAETSGALTAHGGAGDDSIVGGAGKDVISGGAGSDTLDGGKGIDMADYSGSTAGVTVNLTTNKNTGGDADKDSLSGFENVTGSAQADSLTGDKNANILIGGAGADTLVGGNGIDDGIDTASYAASTDAVTVDLGTDVNKGGDAEGDSLTSIEVVIGSGKDDSITGRDDRDERLDGGLGGDTLAGGGGNDTLVGGDDGNDRLSDGAGNDSVVGGIGDDTFIAGEGDDTLMGGDDADTFNMGKNLTDLDRIDGGTSFVTGSDPQVPHNDTLILDGDYATLLTFGATTVVNIETIEVKDGNNYNLKLNNATNTAGLEVDGSDLKAGSHLYLDGKAETTAALTAIGGDDTDILIGGGGKDILTGGGGADTLTGGNGADTASYKGSGAAVSVNLETGTNKGGDAEGDLLDTIENLIGSDNDDTLVGSAANNTLEGGLGADSLAGGLGIDVISYENSADAVTIDLGSAAAQSGGDAAGDTLADIEGVIGSDKDDVITGTGSANLISGGEGNDTLDAECGNDTVTGGDGKDAIRLGQDFAALDRIDGGDGDDTLFLDGNYAAGIVLGAATLVNVETVQLAAGNHYRFTLHDAANTGSLVINGSALGSDETLFVNGAAEISHGFQVGGGGGNDTVTGGAKDDGFSGGGGADILTGNAGNDGLDGGAGNDSLTGGDGNDTLVAGAGTDTMSGGVGNDQFLLTAFLGSADRIDGGSGDDELVLAGDYSGGVVFGAATMINVETITVTNGSSYRLIFDQATNAAGMTVNAGALTGANSIYLDGSKETLSNLTATGGAGDDTILGGAGSDSIVGGAGADSLRGGAGVDTLSYAASLGGVNVNLGSGAPQSGGDAAGDVTNGFENLIGSAFDDTLTGSAADNLLIGGAGGDALSGGLGVDTVSYADSKSGGVWVDLSDGTGSFGDAEGDTYTGIENIIGTAEDDWIVGNGAANRLEGGGGEDVLEGGSGNDTLIGGGEDDYLVGGAGADSIDGAGSKDNWASYEDSTAGVTIDLSLETAQKSGGYGNGDILVNIANLVGSDFKDKLVGDSQDNKIDGGDEADFIDGGEGFDYVLYDSSDAAVVVDFNNAGAQSGGHAQGDILAESEGVTGSAFNDRLVGDGEANALYGNGGTDTLTGGALSDIFGFNTIGNGIVDVDIITDFQVGVGGDVLHIGNILEGYNGSINDFMRIVSSGGQTVMQIDTDGALNGENFVSCAILNGVSSGISVDALLANNQINPLPGTI